MHYKLLLDPAKYLQAADFPKPREVTIARVAREELPARKDEPRQSAPMLYILDKHGKEYDRPLKLPKSVLHGIQLMYGTETDGWLGKKLTLFATKCLAFGDEEECIRVLFSTQIDGQVRKWLKKRKAPAHAYMIGEPPKLDVLHKGRETVVTTGTQHADGTVTKGAPAPGSDEAREMERQAAIERGEA